MRPNIVYIMADDLGYGDLSCYHSEKIQTPHIDAVAKAGIRLTDIHSSSAVCTPSRYSIMTGRYCWRSWLKKSVLGGFGAPLIEKERMTVASMLQKHGYSTAAIGKWHLGLDWYTKAGEKLSNSTKDGWNTDGFDVDYNHPLGGGPLELGFDYWFGIAGSLDMPPYCFLENNLPVSEPVMEKNFYGPQQRRGMMQADWKDEEVDIIFAQKAVDFINSHARKEKNNPFFLYLTPSAPHRPCLPPDFIKGKSQAGLRGDMVCLFDWVVGEIVHALNKNNLTDKTLLIITSDNGARLTNFNGKDYGHKPNGDLRGGKGDIYDGGHREPFVAMWQGVIPQNTFSDELLGLTDFFATCADIVGYQPKSNEAIDSKSFLNVLRGDTLATPIHDSIVHHSADGMYALRMGEWKMILGLGSGGFSEPSRYSAGINGPIGQLYNINDDSREVINHWNSRPDIIEKMGFELKEIQEKEV